MTPIPQPAARRCRAFSSHLLSGRRRWRSSPPPVALLGAVALAAAQLSAQTQFEQFAALPAGGSSAVAMGDVDGDGDPDVVFAPVHPSTQVQLMRNDGRGRFTDVTAAQMPAEPSYFDATSIEFVDVDGDQDLDLVIGAYLKIRLYLNDGHGVFSDASGNVPPTPFADCSLAVGDVDQDGDLDLVAGNGTYNTGGVVNRLYLNDGHGVFVDAPPGQLPVDFDNTRDIALGDLDGDGDLDLVCANRSLSMWCGYQPEPNRIYVNDGAGYFTEGAWPVETSPRASETVALGDVDGDGDLDMVVGNRGTSTAGCSSLPSWISSTSAGLQLFLNDGAGTFVEATQLNLPATGGAPYAIEIGDVDGDGAVDIAWSEPFQVGQASLRLLRNTGAGAFVDATSRMPSGSSAPFWYWFADLALGDVDGDGDLDIAFANAQGDNTVLSNLLRQLDAPMAPAIGQSYQLDLYARYGMPRIFDVALPYVSIAPAAISLPGLGTVGIDLTQAVALPPLLIPQPAGIASTSFPVPNHASLVGLELFAQAAHVPFPQPIRCTNVVRGVVQ